jgi:putative SOS response-associated peptidase YedK
MAGLPGRWQDPARTKLPPLEPCTTIVIDANARVAELHEAVPEIVFDGNPGCTAGPARRRSGQFPAP